jgi:hypothetical protein
VIESVIALLCMLLTTALLCLHLRARADMFRLARYLYARQMLLSYAAFHRCELRGEPVLERQGGGSTTVSVELDGRRQLVVTVHDDLSHTEQIWGCATFDAVSSTPLSAYHLTREEMERLRDQMAESRDNRPPAEEGRPEKRD